MRFSVTAALVAYVGSVLAQNPDFNPVYKPESGAVLVAGSTVTIEWTTPEQYADVTISIELIGGATQNTQMHVVDVASGVPNSDESYEWTIPSDVGGANFYGLILTSESNPDDWQFSNPFNIVLADDADETDDDDDDDDTTPSASPTANDVSETVTVTTSVGTATVTLSLAEPASTSVAAETSSIVEEPTSSIPTETFSSFVVSSSAVPTTLVSSPTVAPPPSEAASEIPSSSSPVPSDDPDSAGVTHKAAAGIYALVGGLVVALMM
ncbi:hypothetical protein SODALDRAFT_194031 [Sodiomyces alkalinus F11]|uniref:Yeast cell wall synthesis Kre9/Knh1-like N-terminal domain-containing protein n=1 Tax=Sodiomyces alkalinus (strain CBS 110278 / VKM F-3762 / F11) TaxID=1314773 RepID=A0A3N2PSA1_SODAK|nr:hypothetical protein SODALDRAFT_194031 [Sodiomyces alkalinus F11]ROT37314.1 hypothetical protein SODALDRAFT_194031 [Sodiomyces alkalinus F11]